MVSKRPSLRPPLTRTCRPTAGLPLILVTPFPSRFFPRPRTRTVEPSTPVTRGLMAHLMYQLALKPEGLSGGKGHLLWLRTFTEKARPAAKSLTLPPLRPLIRSLPFGTWLKVNNLDNGKETYVRVNDRGPYGDDETDYRPFQGGFRSHRPPFAGSRQGLHHPRERTTWRTADTRPPLTAPAPLPSSTFA